MTGRAGHFLAFFYIFYITWWTGHHERLTRFTTCKKLVENICSVLKFGLKATVQVTRRVFNIKTRESNPRRGDNRCFSSSLVSIQNTLKLFAPGSRWWFGWCQLSSQTLPWSTFMGTPPWLLKSCPMATQRLTTAFSPMGHWAPDSLADCPAMSFVFVCWQINIRNRNQLSWAIN